MNKPTPEQVEQTLARLGKPGASAYFFDRLNNPLWIEPLAEKGFFKRPPAAEHSAEQGTVAFPDWPELRYLQRMAELAPDAVGKIVVAMPDTDNTRVRQTLALIGAKLPKAWAQKLGKDVGDWLDQTILRVRFGDAFAQLIAHLARLGDSKLALSISKQLFVVEASADSGEQRRAPDAWHFEHYLKQCLPDLKRSNGVATLDFLMDRLLTATKRDSHSPLEDYSYIWRRDILKANFSAKQVRDVLIDAVRDVALDLAKDPAMGAEKICKRLLAPGRPLLKRVSLYVASQTAGPNDPVVGELLSDINLVDRPTCQAEYGLLLEALFPKLPGAEQERVTQLLMGTDLLQAIPESARDSLDDERKAHYSKEVERDRLLAFGQSLPDALRPRLTQLLGEAGKRPAEELGVTAFAAASPLSADQIQSMSVDDLLKFIESWKPGSGFREPTPESLAQQLQAAARARADEFSAQAEKWIGQDPTYVRWIIIGLSDVVASKGRIADWKPLLNLMSWAVQQPDPPDAADTDQWSGRDVGWAWVRQSIARLIERALTEKDSGLVEAADGPVSQLLEILLQDPDPAPREDTGDEDEHSALTLSVNSTRGIATEALIRYLWRTHPNDSTAGPLTFEATPQVRTALEKALQDPAAALRSVFGQWLQTLFHFDFNWTAARVDEIFPEQVNMRGFWRAAWSTFMDFSGPFDPAFDVLRGKYAFAIGLLEQESEDTNKRMGERGLGKHLASYFWRGVGGEQSSEFLLTFFDRCSATVAGDTVAFIGRGLQSEAPIPAPTVDRLMRLWDALSGTHAQWSERKTREVARQFGEWFSSPHLNEEWSLNALEACLASGAGLVESEGIITRLTALAVKLPVAVSRCTALLVQDDQQFLLPSLWQREMSVLLKTLVESPDPAPRANAEAIINRLIESGSLFARDILHPPH